MMAGQKKVLAHVMLKIFIVEDGNMTSLSVQHMVLIVLVHVVGRSMLKTELLLQKRSKQTIHQQVMIFPNTSHVVVRVVRSEEHTSELQSRGHLVCRLLLEKKKKQ